MSKLELPDFLRLIKGDLDDGDEEVDLLLAEPIGFDPYTYTGMSSNRFGQILNSIPKKKVVNLQINTMGGSVSDGVAMANMVMARGNVNCIVIGYAASMGAIIHQGGAVRKMMPGTMIVIHNPQASIDGDSEALNTASEYLAQVKGNLVDLLASRTKNSKKKISDWMDATTAFTPKEAKEAGFTDEVIESSPAWNNFDPKAFFNSCRQLQGATAGGGIPASNKQNKNEHMKLLMALLAKNKLVSSPELADELAAQSAELLITNLYAERDRLKLENEGHVAAQKTRVTNMVESAITDKLIKPERKQALIDIGIRNEAELTAYLSDVTEVRNSATPQANQRRAGAPALPPENKGGANDKDAKMADLRNEMKTASPARCSEISRELRTLRGHTNLFSEPAAKAT